MRRTGYPALGSALAVVMFMSGCAATQTYRSPDSSLVVVVRESHAMIDAVWEVSVKPSQPFAEQSVLGCLNDDSGPVLTDVRWSGPRVFVIDTGLGGGNGIQVEVNDAGAPISVWPDEIFAPCRS